MLKNDEYTFISSLRKKLNNYIKLFNNNDVNISDMRIAETIALISLLEEKDIHKKYVKAIVYRNIDNYISSLNKIIESNSYEVNSTVLGSILNSLSQCDIYAEIVSILYNDKAEIFSKIYKMYKNRQENIEKIINDKSK